MVQCSLISAERAHQQLGGRVIKPANPKASLRCAVYTRVSTEHGLEQEFNSLDNQREASEAYIKSQAHEGWRPMRDRYDDGGFSGGSMERPALKKLLDAVRARRIDVIVVYKVDRLTRSLADFAKLVELFDEHQVSALTAAGRLSFFVVRETEFCGLRLAGEFRRRTRENGRNSVRGPRHASLTDRNYEGFCRPGNRVGLPGLDGGGCRNRTDGHRSLASLQNEAARRGFSARNDLSQRMSKSLAGKPKALTINRYLPVSLRFHSLSSRSTAMVVTCSRALRRLQE